MITLLVIIYVLFISLGLPDSLFSVCWPLMHVDYHVDVAFGSSYSIITGIATAISSFCGGWLIKKFGTGKVSAVSVLLTALGMLGTAIFNNFYAFIGFTILSGLGAGAIDTGLNNFISLHYKAIHMNWLHCFWGVGVCISPFISSFFLKNNNWQGCYYTIAIIQFIIVIVVFASLFLWKKHERPALIEQEKPIHIKEIFKTRGIWFAILSLGLYCCIEFTLGTWGSTFIINTRNLSVDVAALYVTIYYGGIMVGRFISGLVSLKLDSKNIIYIGLFISFIGILSLFISNPTITICSFALIGFGFGPIFPSTLHIIPELFGEAKSTQITGIMTSGAYLLGFAMQVAYGIIAPITTYNILPYILIAICIMNLTIYILTLKIAIKKR